MARKLPKLGRRVNEEDYLYADYIIEECSVERSGFGAKLLTSTGEYKPRHLFTKEKLNKYPRSYFKLPITAIALHRMGINPAYIYSDPSTGRVIFNIDCDNKWNLPIEEFREQVEILIYLLGMEGVYIQRSTNGKGFHCYGTLRTENIDVQEIKHIFNNLQKFANNICKDNDLKIHVDILGHPSVYDENCQIVKKGTLVKIPFDLEIEEERFKFESRKKFDPEFFDHLFGWDSLEENKKVKIEKKINNNASNQNSSIFTKANLDLQPYIESWFKLHYGTDKIRINSQRDSLCGNEFAYYAIAIDLASKRASKGKPQREEWKDTLPMNNIKQAYESITEDKAVSKWNERKYRHVRQLLESYDLLNIIDKTYKPTTYNEDGEVLELGISAKWRVKHEDFKEFFKKEEKKGTIYVSNTVSPIKGTLFQLNGIISINLFLDYSDFCIDPGDYALSC